MTQPPFFIVGCPRSGTTLIQRLLETHPDVAIPQETHFIATCHEHTKSKAMNPEDFPDSELQSYFLDSRRFKYIGVDRQILAGEVAVLREPLWHSIWLSCLQVYLKTSGKKRVGEKTPHHILYLEEIFSIFPGSRALVMIRDPRAVVASLIKAGFGPKDAAGCAMQWLTLNAAGLSYANRYPDRVLPVFYETLIARPEETIQSVCRFLDLSYDPSMLQFHEQAPTELNLQNEPWKEGVTRPLYTESLDRWEQELSNIEIASIEARCGRLMKLFGYTPKSKAGKISLIPFLWSLLCFFWKSLRQVTAKDRLSRQFFGSQSHGFSRILANRI